MLVCAFIRVYVCVWTVEAWQGHFPTPMGGNDLKLPSLQKIHITRSEYGLTFEHTNIIELKSVCLNALISGQELLIRIEKQITIVSFFGEASMKNVAKKCEKKFFWISKNQKFTRTKPRARARIHK